MEVTAVATSVVRAVALGPQAVKVRPRPLLWEARAQQGKWVSRKRLSLTGAVAVSAVTDQPLVVPRSVRLAVQVAAVRVARTLRREQAL